MHRSGLGSKGWAGMGTALLTLSWAGSALSQASGVPPGALPGDPGTAPPPSAPQRRVPLPGEPGAPTAGDCVPACRSGYMCHQGACVSLCNPPCGAGERCTEEGACVAQQAAAPPPAPAGSVPPSVSGAGWGAPQAPPPEDPGARDGSSQIWRREGVTGILHLGYGAFGGGSAEVDCQEKGDYDCGSSDEYDYDEKSPVVIAAEVLAHTSPGFRIGGGLWFNPHGAVEFDGADENYHFGWEVAPQLILEGVVEASPTVGIAFRGQGGLLLVVPAGDLSEDIDDVKKDCKDLKATSSDAVKCEFGEGPFPGYTYGFGVGVISGKQSVRFRGDLIAQFYHVRLNRDYQTTADSFTGVSSGREVTPVIGGARGWILAGIEF